MFGDLLCRVLIHLCWERFRRPHALLMSVSVTSSVVSELIAGRVRRYQNTRRYSALQTWLGWFMRTVPFKRPPGAHGD